MDTVQILLIICGVLGTVLFGALIVVFFISRRSQKIMQSLLDIMLQPQRTQVTDAVRVLETVLAGEITKISDLFNSMQTTLANQIDAAEQLKHELGHENEILVDTAEEAVKKVSTMSGRLENTVEGLGGIVSSDKWESVEQSTEKFSNDVNTLLDRVENTTQHTIAHTNEIQTAIENWNNNADALSEKLKSEFEQNDVQMKTINENYENMQQKIIELSDKTAGGFENVKTAAGDYDEVMKKHNKSLDSHLVKMNTFFKQSSQNLTDQQNILVTTANVAGAQIGLAEKSLNSQLAKLSELVDVSLKSANTIASELTAMNNRFGKDIKDFSSDVVKEITTVSGAADKTLKNTQNAATAFAESVRAMATGVRDTLIEMNSAHGQLKGQSENLIKMSTETTAQLQPLSELIERYFAALPDLRNNSIETSAELAKIVDNMNNQIEAMKQTVAESTESISQSAINLDDLAGQSRQQMIDLMSDYAQAVNTMQTLNKQMAIARATAPMDAISAGAPAPKSRGMVNSADFMQQAERMMGKIHELSVDLTQTTGAEIPNVVWEKYHAGDNTMFTKWLARIMVAADKKQIRDMLKSNSAFRNQSEQFVRAFDKIMDMVPQTDKPAAVTEQLTKKTDLGKIYTILKPLV